MTPQRLNFGILGCILVTSGSKVADLGTPISTILQSVTPQAFGHITASISCSSLRDPLRVDFAPAREIAAAIGPKILLEGHRGFGDSADGCFYWFLFQAILEPRGRFMFDRRSNHIAVHVSAEQYEAAVKFYIETFGLKLEEKTAQQAYLHGQCKISTEWSHPISTLGST